MNSAGQAAVGVTVVLLIFAGAMSTIRVHRERAAVLSGLIGEPISIGLSVSHGAIPFGAVIEAVDGQNSVQFTSLRPLWGPDEGRWTRWAGIHDDGWAWQTFVRWVETRDGTRWTW